MKVRLIYAVGSNGEFGSDGKMPWPKLTEDFKHFRKCTAGHAVIMGRKTWESLGQDPLANRLNIVVTAKVPDHDRNGRVLYAGNLQQALSLAHAQQYREAWVIGGPGLLKEAMPLATDAFVTHVYGHWDADVFMSCPDWGSFPSIAVNVDARPGRPAFKVIHYTNPAAPLEENVAEMCKAETRTRLLKIIDNEVNDPLDMPLPCDVTIGCNTLIKGTALRSLVKRTEALYELAIDDSNEALSLLREYMATTSEVERSMIGRRVNRLLARHNTAVNMLSNGVPAESSGVKDPDFEAIAMYERSGNAVTCAWSGLPKESQDFWRRQTKRMKEAEDNPPTSRDGYVSVADDKPKCNMKPGSFGVPVLIKPVLDGEPQAWYGCRVTDEPSFYRYGAVLEGVQQWKLREAAESVLEGEGVGKITA